jgi:spermidine synthase
LSWFGEKLHRGYSQQIEYSRVIHQEKTAFQDLAILETERFGRVLTLDGVIQTTERDEFIYHEMLAHVPLFALAEPRRVLIIGGGDGGLLREVLRHPVEEVVMVEIDGVVVERCREHMPSLSAGAFDDPRTDLRIADGIDYVAHAQDPFDAVLVDSTDPSGPGEVLFTDAFYRNCRRLLRHGGVFAAQNGVAFLQGEEVATTNRRLKPIFADVGFFFVAVPTYIGGLMALTWASDEPALRRQPIEAIRARYKAAGVATRYYSPDIQEAAFAAPPYVLDLMR